MKKISRETSRLELLGRCYSGDRIQGVWNLWGEEKCIQGFGEKT